ncbi:DNA sulfur modification protein DndD [Salinadaptatus halalkaliphilus]|uniref:DNA sulfur modification protein DndD n=1 Tax=Salinadaptatus halalkaliphilus TaxID=2419781 RepID=A0A4V3VL55_9EURY|nr:DNA sulfur modification protein DndD [Salinadaptatus halalkaliphilus]THE64287.1 DNA sulfur modification protein DndD [Salinadaptatus halalkaliphilus]
MKLNRLVITDYGPYKGTNELTLSTTNDEPIVLFGGMNGAGKTTLFNAIQICLHGRSAFEGRISRQEYHSRVRSKLHSSNGEKADKASIKLAFEYGNLGDTEEYVVERSWRNRGKSLEESLSIMRDGSKLTDLREDNWEDFLKELIPPGISQLFFFDGEKVQQLASAIEEGDDFEEALLSLLGLDLVERLDADLSIYLSSKLDESGHEEIAEEIESLRHEKADLEAEYEQLEAKIDRQRREMDEITERIEKKETKLTQEGGAFAKERDSLKERREELDDEIDDLEEQIREVARNAYPFALVPELCQEVVDQLKSEQKAETEAAAKARVVNELDELTADDELWTDFDIPDEQRSDVVQRLQLELAERFEPDGDSEPRLSKDFSDRQQERMRRVVDDALNVVPEELQKLTERLEQLNRERQDTVQQLQRAPEQSVISPILKDINDLNQEQGKLQNKIEQHVGRLETLETKIGQLESDLQKKEDQLENLEDVSERAELAGRTRKAVQDYQEALVRKKLQRLESVLTDRYLQLTNKNELYDNIIVDPDELTIEIETVNGNRKDQSELSAGERQIFATAMLWALAEISDRPLPFIIDTPLGRLDNEHRSNLVERFFPAASHQVLLFSTDTEITEEYYDRISDDIAHEYHLQHGNYSGQTEIKPGYFWSDHDDETEIAEVEKNSQKRLPTNNE